MAADPPSHNLRVDEDAVEIAPARPGPVGGYPDSANPKAKSQGEMG